MLPGGPERLVLGRYLLASVAALGVDTGCFLALMRLGLAPAPASATGYMIGIAVHWMLSSRAVFAASVAPRGSRRARQKALFVGSALVGLMLTIAVVGTGAALGLDPRMAKVLAVVISFAATWLLRQRVVFA